MFLFNLLWYEIKFFTNIKNRMYIYILFFQPLIFLTIISLMANAWNRDISSNYIIAVSLLSFWSYILYSLGSSILIEKWNQTINLIIGSNTTFFKIIFNKALSNAIVALLSLVFTWIYAVVFFDINFHIQQVFSFLFCMFLIIISMVALGTFLAIFFSLISNPIRLQNLLNYPLIIFFGLFYPIDKFPMFIQIISYCFPPTWAIKSIYLSLDNNSIYFSATISIVLSSIYFLISYWSLKVIEKKYRVDGSQGV